MVDGNACRNTLNRKQHHTHTHTHIYTLLSPILDGITSLPGGPAIAAFYYPWVGVASSLFFFLFLGISVHYCALAICLLYSTICLDTE